MTFSSNGIPGKAVGSLPVAMIMFLAVMLSFFPSSPLTWLHYMDFYMVLVLANEPEPFM